MRANTFQCQLGRRHVHPGSHSDHRHWRPLPEAVARDLEQFEGAGVYYSATFMEAQLCVGDVNHRGGRGELGRSSQRCFWRGR